MGERKKSPMRRSIADWLPDLEQHQSDYPWLARHYTDIYQALAEDIRYPRSAQDAIDAFKLIFQYAMTRPDFDKLQPLLYDGLFHARELKDFEAQMQIWLSLGHNNLYLGSLAEAETAFETAAYYEIERNSPDQLLLMNIGRVKTDALRQIVNEDVVWQSLDLASRVSNFSLVPTLYSTLAMAYLYIHDIQQALGYGQMAYCGWYNEDNEVELANCAFILAETYRKADLLPQAAHFVERADHHLHLTDYPHKRASYRYQEGLQQLQAQNFAAAEIQLREALAHLQKLPYSHLTAAAQHSLGLALTHTGKFQEAREQLKAAFVFWCRLENWLEQANVFQALGYLAYRQGNNRRALHWYYAALRRCGKANASPSLERLRRDIRLSIEDLEQNSTEG